METERQCRRCGTCCRKGGPTLHQEDLPLLKQGVFSLPDLITVRKGEPAWQPVTEAVEPAAAEFIKIAGQGAEWECIFHDRAGASCTIHAQRPLECRLLKCWAPEEVRNIIGRNCLNRFDLIATDDPIRDHITRHEEKCSYAALAALQPQLPDPALHREALAELRAIMAQDLKIRDQAITTFRLTLPLELFYFGRPLFKVLRIPDRG